MGNFIVLFKETFYTNGINPYTCEVFMYNFASGVNFLRKKFAGAIFANRGKNEKIAKN